MRVPDRTPSPRRALRAVPALLVIAAALAVSGWPPGVASPHRVALQPDSARARPITRCGPTREPFFPGRWPGGCWRPYGAASPFNQPLPASPRVARGSAAIVRRLRDFGPPQNLVIGTAGTRDDYAHPVYFARSSDPVHTLSCQGRFGPCPIDGRQVRIPVRAQPARGGDAHLAVIDQQTGIEYDLFEARKSPQDRVVRFTFGGTTSIGGDGLAAGATASGFGLLAGSIRAAELERGAIRHALFMTALCDNGTFVPPAVKSGQACSEIGRSNANAPPMGARLQLHLSRRAIDALDVPFWTRAILVALARYGAFIGDTGGSSWGLQLESGATYTSFGRPDPLVTFARRVDLPTHGTHHVLALNRVVDWRRLRVIDPCVTVRRC
jgi:hypothetical protein